MTYQTLETVERLDSAARMPAGRRLPFLALARVPLAAPHALFIQPRWTDYLNPFSCSRPLEAVQKRHSEPE